MSPAEPSPAVPSPAKPSPAQPSQADTPATTAPRTGKNIVICCDGTGNQYGDDNSNVVKLYTCLDVNATQFAYYHPGVGTMGDPRQTTWIGKKISQVAGMGFGAGFTANLADAYRFLMEEYATGDRIYLFGFSRGAYTVRALAGAIRLYGLLCRGNEGHLDYLLRMFSQRSKDTFREDRHKQIQPFATDDGFRETFSRTIPIHFMGIWDTVSSIGGIYDPVKLLYDGQNSIVRRIRHAVSVDERRCFFQANLVGKALAPPNTPVLADHYPNPADHTQNILQAWFAGVHSDVGGSYLQSESGPAMDAFRWILEEAAADGLEINTGKRDAIFGIPSRKYASIAAMNVPAPAMDCLHDSLHGAWWLLEAFPHKYFDENGKLQWRYTPWPHSREIPDGALLHPSLRNRLAVDLTYQPKNLDRSKVFDYGDSPEPLPQADLMAQLKDQGYAVYRPGPAPSPVPVRSAAGIAALFLVSLAAWVLRR